MHLQKYPVIVPLAWRLMMILLLATCSASCCVAADTTQALHGHHRHLRYSARSSSSLDPTETAGLCNDNMDNLQRSACYFSGLTLRGGARQPNRKNSGPIELNPSYFNEHEAWLREQQRYDETQQKQYHPKSSSSSFPFGGGGRGLDKETTSLVEQVQNYFLSLHQISPSLFWSTLVSIAIFGMWQTAPRFSTRNSATTMLHRYFVNNHANIRKTYGLSLVLPSLSHISPYHLLVNLMSFSHLGPSVLKLLPWTRSGSSNKMWSLLLFSSIFSNAFFLLLHGRGASSLGLSGVTMSLLAIQAMATPNRVFGIVLGGIFPVSLQARHLLQLLVVGSLVGSFVSASSTHWGRRPGGSSPIAHGAHLGGLLYGMLYYEMVILGLPPRQLCRKILDFLRRAI